MRIRHIAFVAAAIFMGAPASATVLGAGPSGFQIQEVTRIAAPPAKVWDAILHPGGWWNAEHSYSHDSSNMTIEPRAGGCWCEKWGGNSVEHMRVVMVMPPAMLRLRGALGPLQAMGVEGALTWTLRGAVDGGTEVTLDYGVGGYAARPFPGLAQAVDGVLTEQVNRLQMFVQTGNPVATATQ